MSRSHDADRDREALNLPIVVPDVTISGKCPNAMFNCTVVLLRGSRDCHLICNNDLTGPVKSSSQSDKAPPVTGRIQIQRAARQAAELGLTNDCIGDPSRKLLFMLRLGLSPKSGERFVIGNCCVIKLVDH